MSSRVRRAFGLTAVPALALSTLAVLPSAPASAAEPDPAPVAAGATWLEGELTGGVIHNDQFDFDDYGLTIDSGLALVEIGGHGETVDTISDAVAAGIGNYVGNGTSESYAGALAKAAVFARAAGDNPAAYGGVDLVDRLEDRVLTEGATAGRIQDLSEFGDFANVIGQSYAVRGLDEANSTLTDSATDFLLAQQCEEGFFRQDFSAIDSADQTCDGDATPAPDTDVTALAVLALQGQADDTDVAAALDAAVTWLLAEQKANGSFGASPLIQTPNTNSTGLAGWALAEAGEAAAAEKAAFFVRALQADEPVPCTTQLVDDQGAIAYDVSALAAGRGDGITVQLQDQWRRATAQALPVLQWAPLTGSGGVVALETPRFHQPGDKVTLPTPGGLAPGDTVCFTLAGRPVAVGTVRLTGQALGTTTLPEGTARRTYRYTNGAVAGVSHSYYVLDAKTLRFDLKSQVARGEKQVVKLRGLAAGESYKVKYRGTKVGAGTANSDGKATVRFPVGRRLGPAEVLVIGEFANRRGKKTFRVVR